MKSAIKLTLSPAAWPPIKAQQWWLQHTTKVFEHRIRSQKVGFFVEVISGRCVLRFYFQPTVWGINRTWWDVDHQPGEGVLDDLCRDWPQWLTSYCQDARRRKLDSGRVDAEAVIDELMEVKKYLQVLILDWLPIMYISRQGIELEPAGEDEGSCKYLYLHFKTYSSTERSNNLPIQFTCNMNLPSYTWSYYEACVWM